MTSTTDTQKEVDSVLLLAASPREVSRGRGGVIAILSEPALRRFDPVYSVSHQEEVLFPFGE